MSRAFSQRLLLSDSFRDPTVPGLTIVRVSPYFGHVRHRNTHEVQSRKLRVRLGRSCLTASNCRRKARFPKAGFWHAWDITGRRPRRAGRSDGPDLYSMRLIMEAQNQHVTTP